MNYYNWRNLNYELKTPNGRSFYPSGVDKNIFIYSQCEEGNHTETINAVPCDRYDKLITILNEHDNISVYLNKIEGTTTDVLIIKNKCFSGIREMKSWFKENDIKLSYKYLELDFLESQ